MQQYDLSQWFHPKADEPKTISKLSPPWVGSFLTFVSSGFFYGLTFTFLATVVIPLVNLLLPKHTGTIEEIINTPTLRVVLASLVFWIIVVFSGFIWFFWRHEKKKYTCFIRLHRLFHLLRNSYFKYYFRRGKIEDRLYDFGDDVCDQVAIFFNSIIEHDDIDCCIRVKNNKPVCGANRSQVEYITIGRSSELRDSREISSESIRAEEGIPAALQDKLNEDECSVLVVRNVQIAAADRPDLWKKTKNDEKTNIVSVLVCPINCREKEGKGGIAEMIGILYITSQKSGKKCPFDKLHVEIESLIADSLASMLSHFLAKNKN